jgi:tetratricopeptide (TPR) repeat protein
MRLSFARMAFLTVLGASRLVHAQVSSEITLPPNGNNQRAEVSQWIGLLKVMIAYHSPRVHFPPTVDRTGHIWGELVRYGFFDEGFGPSKATPWRAGANESTTISFSHDVKVDGRNLKAGTYALFLLLEPSAPWTWIFSTNSTGWGSFQYDSTKDALRVSATPTDAPFTEFLTYGFDDRLPNAATAYLQWEKKRISFKIDVPNVNDLYIAQLRNDLQSWPGFNYQNWQQAAAFAVNNSVALDEALIWANKAIYEPFRNAAAGREDFSTLQTKAAVLHALHRDADADTTMDRAIRLPTTSVVEVHQYAVSLLTTGRQTRALEIFRLNRQLHPDEKFWTYLGLARGYTATGDKKSAIANWEIALRNVPPNLTANVPSFQKALQALKEGR